jgi:hypothetical protein
MFHEREMEKRKKEWVIEDIPGLLFYTPSTVKKI